MFATGVTIVTARAPPTARWSGSQPTRSIPVSLSPPLVLWSLALSAPSMPTLSTGSHYAINILSANQKELAERFAKKRDDRWQDVAFTEGIGGAPVLAGAAASFECFNRSHNTTRATSRDRRGRGSGALLATPPARRRCCSRPGASTRNARL